MREGLSSVHKLQWIRYIWRNINPSFLLFGQRAWTPPRQIFSVEYGGLVAGVTFGLFPTHVAYSNAPDPPTPSHSCRLTPRGRFAAEREFFPTLVDRDQHCKGCSINQTKRGRRATDGNRTAPRPARDPGVAPRPPKTHVHVRIGPCIFPRFIQVVEIVLDCAV